MSNLGRVSSRAGRFDEAAKRFADANALFAEIGADAMLIETEARDIERLVYEGDHEEALARVDDVAARARKLELVNVANMLDRLSGCAWCQQGDTRRGIALLERSIIESRERRADYEALLSMAALVEIGRAMGRPGTVAMAAHVEAALTRLGVVDIAHVPVH